MSLFLSSQGADGRERGEDDTNFERQSALFALAVADVLLVNIWCHDVGREQGSGKPLLKTIFQVCIGSGRCGQKLWGNACTRQLPQVCGPAIALACDCASYGVLKNASARTAFQVCQTVGASIYQGCDGQGS